MIDYEELERRCQYAKERDAAEKRRMDIEWNVFIIGLGFVMGYFGYDLIDCIIDCIIDHIRALF